MTDKRAVHDTIDRLPDDLVQEVRDFVEYLESKNLKGKSETALLAESALRKDWLTPVEDEAWQDL
jgi:hypothetical protein